MTPYTANGIGPHFDALIETYGIKPEWHHVLPSEKDTAFPLCDGKVTLSADFFKFSNFRPPITRFCKEILDKYVVHISQVHPLDLMKLRHFEYASLSLGYLPEKLVFRAFYTLARKAPLFTFDPQSTDVSCLRLIPSSSRDKDWN
ncbi:hypothetical protein Hanom_Chr10g00935811 [Helianthus anomalus]